MLEPLIWNTNTRRSNSYTSRSWLYLAKGWCIEPSLTPVMRFCGRLGPWLPKDAGSGKPSGSPKSIKLKTAFSGTINHACPRGRSNEIECGRWCNVKPKPDGRVDVTQIGTTTGDRFILGGFFVIGSGRAMHVDDRCIGAILRNVAAC